MKISVEQYERLMRFLDLDMSATEMEAFAKELESDPELKTQLNFEQNIREGLNLLYGQHAEVINEQSKDQKKDIPPFGKYKSRYRAKRKNKPRVLKIWLPTAIAACLITAVALIYIFNPAVVPHAPVVNNKDTNNANNHNDNVATNKNDTNPKVPVHKKLNFVVLFKAFYLKDTIPVQTPGMLANALIDYENNYYSTIQKIELQNFPKTRGPDTDPLNDAKYIKTIGHYYKGISYIETGSLKSAVENLRWVKDSAEDKKLQVKAQWYLALTYLRAGETDTARSFLQIVASNNEIIFYKKQAQQLLKEMN